MNGKHCTHEPRLVLTLRANGRPYQPDHQERTFLVMGARGKTIRVLYAGTEDVVLYRAREENSTAATDAIQSAMHRDLDWKILRDARVSLKAWPFADMTVLDDARRDGRLVESEGIMVLTFGSRERQVARDIEIICEALTHGSEVAMTQASEKLAAHIAGAGLYGAQVPDGVASCDQTWEQALETAESIRAHASFLMDRLNNTWDESGCATGSLVSPGINTAEFLKDARTVINEYIVTEAARQFIPSGASLTINRHSEGYDAVATEPDVRNYRPSHVWRYLQSSYGNGAGETMAWGAAARILRDRIHRRWGPGPQQKSRGVEMVIEMYAEDRSTADAIDYSYSAKQYLREFIHEGILPFFAHEMHEGAQPPTSRTWANYIDRLFDFQCRFTSREKVVIDGVVITHLKKKVEFLISVEMYGRINAFIARYAPMQDAA